MIVYHCRTRKNKGKECGTFAWVDTEYPTRFDEALCRFEVMMVLGAV